MSEADAGLRRRVRTALKRDLGMKGREVAVSASDGAVGLSADVSDGARLRAIERTVQQVPGVRALAVGLREPAGGTLASDVAIARAVARHLTWHVLDRNGRVTARVHAGWVTLEGEVALLYHRGAAERGLRRVPGVAGVTNLIAVKSSYAADDVCAAIEAALVERAHVEARRIRVALSGEHVVLMGEVSSPVERDEAVRAARAVAGVREIEDRLQITVRVPGDGEAS